MAKCRPNQGGSCGMKGGLFNPFFTGDYSWWGGSGVPVFPGQNLKEYRLTQSGSKYLSIPHGSDINFERTSSFTFSIYVKWESSMVGSFLCLASKRAATGAGWQFFKSDAEKCYLVLIGSGTQATVTIGTATMAANQWHLLTLVYSGVPSAPKFYIDGKLDTTTISTPNTLTSETILNTAAMTIGTRLNTPIYANCQIGEIAIYNVALDVNQVPNTLWNNGSPRAGTSLSGCVRNYRFTQDTFSSNYTLVESVSAANGTSVNMTGTELVSMNSVFTPTPTGITATPKTSSQITIFWESAGYVTYYLYVSDDGVSGWSLVTATNNTYYHHSVGAASTTKYYKVKAVGYGNLDSSFSSVVSATTLSSTYATSTTYFSTHKYGDNSYNFALSVETLRVAPGGYYDAISNKTYFVYMSRAEQGYDMTPYAYYYDHSSGQFSESYYVGLKSRNGQDRHPIPAIIVNSSGYIIVAATDLHNAPMQIWKSNIAGDVSAFTKVTELGTITDYPEFRKMTNGDIYVFCRYYVSASNAGIGYFKSTDGGATWGSLVKILDYTYSVGRPYPTLPPQPNTTDRIHLCIDVRNDTGGPNPGDPDQVGYWKDMGYIYSDDGLTWRNVNNSFSKQVVSSGAITEAQWTTNYQYLDSVGTVNTGLSVNVVTPSGQLFVSHYKDDGTYNVFYHNGTSWVTQALTFPDVAPDYYTFGYQGIQVIRHITGDTFDIYATKTGVVKRYRTTDKFVTLTLEESSVLPAVSTYKYEHGATTHNIYEATEPFLFYSLKVSEPTPTPTSPGAWSDIVLKKI